MTSQTIPTDAYHADEIGHDTPSLSASIAHTLITSSPRHAWTQHPKLNPDFERAVEQKFDLGTVAHALLLQGDDVAEPLPFDDWRTALAKQSRDDVRAAGRIPLLAKDYQRVRQMVDAARDQMDALQVTPALFTDGMSEQTLVWHEPDGTLCRARLDYLHTDLSAIDDLKTTSASANPRTWARRTMWSIGCDIQIAFYLRGLARLYPETAGRVAWRYVVQETYPPYALSVVEAGEDVQTVGREKVDRAVELWRRCLDSGEWPAYPTSPVRAEVPAWVEMELMEVA